ncbi:MAG: hypothetical protein HYZ65_01185 [Burkholderiales bacterium]|nr:hypothetical protein [Burkholderiales bacterium]
MHHKKWESFETRYAQTTKLSDPFSVTHKLLRPQRMKFKSNVKSNGNHHPLIDGFKINLNSGSVSLFLTYLRFGAAVCAGQKLEKEVPAV